MEVDTKQDVSSKPVNEEMLLMEKDATSDMRQRCCRKADGHQNDTPSCSPANDVAKQVWRGKTNTAVLLMTIS